MIESIGLTPTKPSSSFAGSLGGLGGDAFLKLLVAQLKYQNPMEPSDGSQLMQQTAQFTQVETLQQLAAAQQQLMGLSQFSLAVGLAGKQVTAVGTGGGTVSGEVQGIRFTADGPQLEIDTQWIPLSNVLEVDPH
jgi:flagellar basal-body rod modification protein FlgD